jgi:hypothetical protein
LGTHSLYAAMELLAFLPFRIPLTAMAFKQGMEIASRIHALSRRQQQLQLLIQLLLLDLLQQRECSLAICAGGGSHGQRS